MLGELTLIANDFIFRLMCVTSGRVNGNTVSSSLLSLLLTLLLLVSLSNSSISLLVAENDVPPSVVLLERLATLSIINKSK